MFSDYKHTLWTIAIVTVFNGPYLTLTVQLIGFMDPYLTLTVQLIGFMDPYITLTVQLIGFTDPYLTLTVPVVVFPDPYLTLTVQVVVFTDPYLTITYQRYSHSHNTRKFHFTLLRSNCKRRAKDTATRDEFYFELSFK